MVVLTGCWVHWPALCTVSRGSPTSPGMLVSASPILSHAHFGCEIPAYHSSIQLPPKKHLNSMIYELGFALSDKANNPTLCRCCRYETLFSDMWFCFRWMSDGVKWRSNWMPAFSQGEHFYFQLKGAWHVDYQLTLQKMIAWRDPRLHGDTCTSSQESQAYWKVEKQSPAQDGLQQDKTWCSDTLWKHKHTTIIKLLIYRPFNI